MRVFCLRYLIQLCFFIVSAMNSFSNEIPAEFGNLTALVNFTGADNSFTGNLPEELGNLTAIEHLVLCEYSRTQKLYICKKTHTYCMLIFHKLMSLLMFGYLGVNIQRVMLSLDPFLPNLQSLPQ